MIISESGLKRAISQAWGKSGYHIMFDGERMTLFSDDWFVQCDWDKFPRKALATIVEHIGYLPEEGGVLHILKNEDVQTEIPETAGNEIYAWTNRQGEQIEASKVQMQYRGLQIYQLKEGGRCFAVNPTSLQILEKDIAKSKAAQVFHCTTMHWSHDGEQVIIRTANPASAYWEDEEEKAIWCALELLNLHDNH